MNIWLKLDYCDMSSGVRNEEEAIKIVYLTSRMGLTHSTAQMRL